MVKKMNRKIVVSFLSVAMFAFILLAGSTSAYIPANNPSTAVAIVDSYNSPNGGALAHTDPAFALFSFTLLPWANVTTGNLTQFQIVVLMVDSFNGEVNLDETQRSQLVQWVSNGGKLIIYDSELPSINYTWLSYPFTTLNPGAQGAPGTAVFKEENTLGSNNPANTFYYINITVDYITNNWADAIGDCNLFTTFDPHWCGDILANRTTAAGVWETSWVHAYAQYGQGLIIYNGFDLDPIADYGGNSTVPGPNNYNALAKIFLLELAQPWAADYNLPCGTPVVEKEKVPTVGGAVIDPMSALIQPTAVALYSLMALIAGTLAVLITLYRKNASQIVQ